MLEVLAPTVVPGPELRSRQLILRPPRASDYPVWSALRAESRSFLAPWEPLWPPDSLSQRAYRARLLHYREEHRLGSGYYFHLFRRSDHVLLGGISLTNLRRGVAQSVALGYWMGRPHARQGHMSEALAACLDFCFEGLRLHRIEAACLPENEASRRLLRKLGFREEGIARGCLEIAGAWRDHVQHALLSTDPRCP